MNPATASRIVAFQGEVLREASKRGLEVGELIAALAGAMAVVAEEEELSVIEIFAQCLLEAADGNAEKAITAVNVAVLAPHDGGSPS